MIIINLQKSTKSRGIEIRALLSDIEFEHLLGNLKELCIFATKTIAEPATTIKTGVRHSHAKYLLFPSAVRGKLRQRTVSLYRSMSYGLFCPGTI